MPSTDDDVVTLRWVMLVCMVSMQDQWEAWNWAFTETQDRYPELRGHIAAFTTQLHLLTDAVRDLHTMPSEPPAVVQLVADIHTGSSTDTAGSTAAMASGSRAPIVDISSDRSARVALASGRSASMVSSDRSRSPTPQPRRSFRDVSYNL